MRDFEWSGGLESNQNTLKRNKPVQMRPLTRLSDSEYSEFDQRPLTIPNYASSSVDLRNSLERDMLIEQNHLLARELETLKLVFQLSIFRPYRISSNTGRGLYVFSVVISRPISAEIWLAMAFKIKFSGSMRLLIGGDFYSKKYGIPYGKENI